MNVSSTVLPTVTDSYRTKQDIVYRSVRESIVYGSLAPGERLTIRDLATRLGVSETPVRAALIRLQAEGLVEYVSHMGATVALLRTEEIYDAHTMVAVLQGLAAQRAAERATLKDINRLCGILEKLEALPPGESAVEYDALNLSFHKAIAEIGGYTLMVNLMDQLFDWLSRADVIWKRMDSHRSKGGLEHRAILKAIERGNPEQGKSLMEQHFYRARQDFMEQVAKLRLADGAEAPRPAEGVGDR